MDIKVKTIPDADFYDYRLATIFDGYKWDLQAGEQSTISDKVILLGQDDMFFLEKSAVSLYDETVSMERAFWARWNAAHTLSVSTSAIHWGSGANNSTITVTSSANWGVSSNAAWLTISNITGSSFRINATANPNPTQRGATVTVTGGGLSRTVNVTQAAAAASTLTVSQGTWNPTSAASNLTVNVTSNLSWGFSSNVAWLTFSNATPANTTGNGSFRINATANTGAQRTGVVTVTGGGLTRSITVTQAAVNRIITFDLAGGRYNGSPGPINHTIPAGVQIGVSRVPVPVLDGHVFSGWRHADGRLSSREQVGAIIVTHTGTLTAVWTPLIRTITFNLNFGNVNGTPGPINHAIPVGVQIGVSRVPIPTRNGFIFTGWLHADGRISTREQVGAIVVTHTGTLTAQWAQMRTLTFNAGTGATWASAPSGWVRNANNTQITRSVAAGTAWNTITWPTISNLSRAGHMPTIPARPGGNVPATGGMVSWAVTWTHIPPITMNYNIFRGTGVPASEAQRFVDDVKPAFRNQFAIYLVRQSTTMTSALNQRFGGCTLPLNGGCNTDCGPYHRCDQEHHRSRNHFLSVNHSVGPTLAFRFVNFSPCRVLNGEHGVVNGSADRVGGNNMIVTSQSDNPRRTTAHEISHLFGATDGRCSDPLCVMTSGAATHTQWCDNHRYQILISRDFRG